MLLLLFLIAATPISEMPQAELNDYLSALQARQKDYGARVVAVLTRSVGTPYARDPLGEGPAGTVDKDPLMDLQHVDCVTFVEQTIALAASRSYQDAFNLLQKIRYKNGAIAFENRNHFMIADWIANNRFCRDVSSALNVPTATVTRTMGRKYFFETKQLPDLAAKATNETIALTYVPGSEAAHAEPRLPNPALILLIGKVDWLFTLHCGIFVRDDHGNGLFYNASSTEEKVVAAPFTEPFEKSTRYLGFTAYALGDPRR